MATKKNKNVHIIRNQLSSNGLLRTWKLDDKGNVVEYTTVHKELTPKRVAELQELEERVRKIDAKIRRGNIHEGNHRLLY